MLADKECALGNYQRVWLTHSSVNCPNQRWKHTALTVPSAETGISSHITLDQYSKTSLQNIDCYWCFSFSPPDETDGPPGAIAMATMLQSLGKQVTMVTDRRAFEMNQAINDEAVRTGGKVFTQISETWKEMYLYPPPESVNTTERISLSFIVVLEMKSVFNFKEKTSTWFNSSVIPPSGVLKTAIPLVTFEDSGPDSALHFLCHNGDPSKPRLAD